MKAKKTVAILVLFALLQFMFPAALIVYEDSFMKNIVKKGEKYTLDYTQIVSMNKGHLSTNADERYTVGYTWDFENAEENALPYDTVSVYHEVGIEKKEDGTLSFFDTNNSGKRLTDGNWFRTYGAFGLDFADYEFVSDGFGMKEFFELGLFLCDDKYNDTESFEEFMKTDNEGFYPTLHHISLDGKFVLSVYKGMAVITEFYIGDELVLRHKGENVTVRHI